MAAGVVYKAEDVKLGPLCSPEIVLTRSRHMKEPASTGQRHPVAEWERQ